jgi:hypothetical protein
MGSIESSLISKIQQSIHWYIYIYKYVGRYTHNPTCIHTHIYIYYWIFKEQIKPVGSGDFLCRGHDVRRIRGLLQVIFGSLPFSSSKVGQGPGLRIWGDKRWKFVFFWLRCFQYDLCWFVFLWWFYNDFLWFGSERCGVCRMWVIWDESEWQSRNDDE